MDIQSCTGTSSHLILTLAEVVLDVNLSDISGDIWD